MLVGAAELFELVMALKEHTFIMVALPMITSGWFIAMLQKDTQTRRLGFALSYLAKSCLSSVFIVWQVWQALASQEDDKVCEE